MLRYGLFGVFVAFLPFIIATNAECESFPLPDFRAPGRRISERKCLEYNWERKNIEKCSNEPANIDYPFMGIIAYIKESTKQEFFPCAAFLISPKFALTAAVCTALPNKPAYVRFGNNDFKAKDVPRVDAKIKRIITHPEYKQSEKAFDIALIELEEPLPLSKSVQPVCLWSQPSLDVEDAIAPGWGTNARTGVMEAILKEMRVKVMAAEACVPIVEKYFNKDWQKLLDHQLCADEPNAVRLCKGSTGVPLVAPAPLGDEELPRAFAVTSFGFSCLVNPEKPVPTLGVYTKVSSFIDWIERTVWPEES